MKEKFLELIKSIYEVELLSENVKDFNSILNCKVNEINENFGLMGTKEEIKSLLNYGKLPCSPVPLVSSGSNLKFVVFGLNPGFEEQDNIREKILAGNNWNSYGDFYTSSKIFEYLIGEKKSKYYRDIFLVFNSLRMNKFIGWRDFFKETSKNYIPKKYIDIVTEYNICVADFIPYYSNKIGTIGTLELYDKFPYIKNYFTKLMNLVLENLSEDGLIMTNGKAVTDAFIELNRKEVEILLEQKDRGYTLAKYKNRKVLLLHESLRRQGGKLNSYKDIKEMIDFILAYKF